MHIVSYRGPGKAGGVSAALARAWESNLGTGGLWWYLCDNTIEASTGDGVTAAKPVWEISPAVIQGHYRYCNNLLWPVMHDLPQYASYSSEDRALYNSFNETIGWRLSGAATAELPREYFVQDYQLALLPELLRNSGLRSAMFWHIPWPVSVDPEFVEPIAEIARGLLHAEAIGFHTQEYAQNFLRFVREHLHEYRTHEQALAISSGQNVTHVDSTLWVEPNRYAASRTRTRQTRQITRLIVAPLGIDFDHWSALAARQQHTLWHPALVRSPFILSVDRADYTKGVVDRILAIDKFFERFPEWRGKISFAQVSGKTRNGLPAFEQYWEECREAYARLQDHCLPDGWQPLVWLEQSFTPAELAHAYRSAAGMLITAVRDGLNLTAKEFVACQSVRPGVLAMSTGIGAVHELGRHSVTFEPQDIDAIAVSIERALTMDPLEKSWRAAVLKENVRSNTLHAWWQTFASILGSSAPTSRTGTLLRESS